jgi:hypothetical protein
MLSPRLRTLLQRPFLAAFFVTSRKNARSRGSWQRDGVAAVGPKQQLARRFAADLMTAIAGKRSPPTYIAG